MKATTVTGPLAHHGEGPVWNPQRGVLHWVDMLAGGVLTSDPSFDEVHRTEVGEVAAVVRPVRDGGLVVAVERGFALIPPGSDRPERLPEVWSDPSVRMNEGGCDPQGRFYVGSMAYGATPDRGRLFRLDPDGSVSVVLEPVTISNGLNWSLDGETVYYIDTPTGRVDAFDFDSGAGEFLNRRPLIEIDSEHGSPDGMAIDADGRLWVALWGGSAVHCYSTNGTLEEVVELPVRQVTACAFGGDALDTLYITTSRDGLSDPETDAGALFAVTPGVSGVPVLPFAGLTGRE
ncbi:MULTISPECIES: SMP-30/gluconolactonase/LRE family protein [Actinoalloteichus]|uniref:Gluconolactonase n=1 Tax=Actinoalloteichus fjordicus TaxID=1612552 RepID=A0AAC9PQ96_9PSEU|nr:MULTISPECIES: SMP-30/gluconolactonase/LRE family protein [Actinoalloteichus]APU12874.1 gluconolactonase [Actinoalloteichus fjordicus]APU18846.1 gluconolactonase [Actinoalloteichus sp. GBA129-24]